ncbi:MAG: polysaccharide pyruvyl transferase CsaB [Oscillospiraceae bacterium]|nr:polysaccharide pyruvyl transferase CsaB [Oscillospiraceae bacterium]
MKAKKVLMVLMGLEIGGAETHVVELSKELRRRGWDVAVVSNGGVYERELTEAGIRCHRAPLHKRNAALMLRSLHILRRVIREEAPDVVHAHARIPAFLCGILQKQMGFPFVTSAHWVFYVNGLLKRIANWGERTVAVSDDIKTYLIESYGVSAEQISVTINGIDTEKFSPAVSGERVLREFGLSADRPVISYVSRMDESRALVARQLVSIAPRLRERIPGVQLLIAGGGDVFDEIKAKADAANAKAGENYVIMTGARTDINEIVAAGDVFVGVSRAALEAMAAAKPVIVAGNEGYIGLFEESRLALAQSNNFCCRGCEQSTEELLYKDIVRSMCEMSGTERVDLGKYGRSVIQQHYSVSRMAKDCEAAYRAVINEHTRVVVSGYYGFRNLGDDAILLALRDRLSETIPGATLVALSRRPRETREKCGVEAVYRFAPFAVRRAIRGASCFVSGGGSLLQDHTSTRSLLYYTSLIRLAKHFGKPIMFYANGIGPVETEPDRKRVREVAEMADVITLRDEESFATLREMGVINPNITVTADPVYSLEAGEKERGRELLRQRGIPTDKPIIGISVRFAVGMEANITEFARFCDALSDTATVVLIDMQRGGDTAAAAAVRRRMVSASFEISAPYAPDAMADMIAAMEAVVSTRLHSMILAASAHVPVLGVVYDPKVSACAHALDMPEAGTLEAFDAAAALRTLREVLDNRGTYAARLSRNADELREKAAKNEIAFSNMLKKTGSFPESE